MFVFDSGKEGPTTLITGGVHGDEVGGIEAARDFSNARVENGKLAVIVPANAYAAREGVRNTTSRKDGNFGDLNRHFPPGSACEGSIAQALWSEIQAFGPDWVFDCHTARGVWARNGGLGQALFTSPPATKMAIPSAKKVNERHGLSADREFRVHESVRGDDPMLADKAYAEADAGSIILEITEDGTGVDTQKQWLVDLISDMMNSYGQSPIWN